MDWRNLFMSILGWTIAGCHAGLAALGIFWFYNPAFAAISSPVVAGIVIALPLYLRARAEIS